MKQICGENTGSSSTSAAEAADGPEAPAELAGNAEVVGGGGAGAGAGVVERSDAEMESADLRRLLESLLPVMASARGFYSNLPDSVCSASDGPFANSTDVDCWNGQRIGT